MVTPRLFVASCSATVRVSNEAIVPKFVFIDKLTGVSLVRQVEFRIDLVPGVALVAMTPVRLIRPNERTSCSIFWVC